MPNTTNQQQTQQQAQKQTQQQTQEQGAFGCMKRTNNPERIVYSNLEYQRRAKSEIPPQ